MRLSTGNAKRYSNSHIELDGRTNEELVQKLDSSILPRDPRGGGRGGGGGKAGTQGGSGGSGSGSGSGNGGSGGGSRGGVSFGGGTSGRGSSSYGSGGGRITTLTSGVFAGRSVGGGTRDQVYGSSRYGSGYTYAGSGSFVSGRGFPFGYWPVYVPIGGAAAYYEYHEYGPPSNSSRPGGGVQQALVRSSNWPVVNARRWLEARQKTNSTNSTMPAQVNNTTASYYIVGDADTVAAVMQELVKSCSVVNASGVPVNETNPTVHFEQAVQFYRASSFMLALTSYNNTANLPANAPANSSVNPMSTNADTPLPSGTDMTFLNCLNTTIGASIPIMNPEATISNSAASQQAFSGMNVIGLVWLVVWLLKML